MDGGRGAFPDRIATACATSAFSCASGGSAGFTGLAAGEVGAGAAVLAGPGMFACVRDFLRPQPLSSKLAATAKQSDLAKQVITDRFAPAEFRISRIIALAKREVVLLRKPVEPLLIRGLCIDEMNQTAGIRVGDTNQPPVCQRGSQVR